MNPDLADLNQQFGIAGVLHFTGTEGLPVIEITTPQANARIAVQGAQVLEWQPAGQPPVLWLSKAAVYQPGKGVRGGVPVCWPWFGAGESGKPAHGFVRTRMWQIREVGQDEQSVFVRLAIHDDSATRALWDYAFDLELLVTIGTTLRMELITHNAGDTAFAITDALHTYFHVGNIVRSVVQGLDQVAYLDKVTGFEQVIQDGAVTFAGETDRIYLDTDAECIIDDEHLQRQIHIAKSGSSTTVVWNPWLEKEKSFADMMSGEYQQMLCVETCNAATDVIILAPDQTHRLVAQIWVT